MIYFFVFKVVMEFFLLLETFLKVNFVCEYCTVFTQLQFISISCFTCRLLFKAFAAIGIRLLLSLSAQNIMLLVSVLNFLLSLFWCCFGHYHFFLSFFLYFFYHTISVPSLI